MSNICFCIENVDARNTCTSLYLKMLQLRGKRRNRFILYLRRQVSRSSSLPVLTIYTKHCTALKWSLEWPEDTLEDGLVTCDQIIERTPYPIAEYHTKRELLWELKRYEQVVDTCHQILALDSKSDYTHYRIAQAYEMLARPRETVADYILDDGFVLALIHRLTPIPLHYEQALTAYDEALKISPDNSSYRESKRNLLRRLGKFNQAEGGSNRTKNNNSTVSRPYWLQSFLLLPFVTNVLFSAILLAVLQHPEMVIWVTIGAFSISGLGAVWISVRDKPYHLYHASILLYPISCFAIGWIIVAFFILHLAMSVSFFLPLVFLLVFSFLGNAFVYFLIDIYEEHTFVLIERRFDKALEWIGKALIEVLRWFFIICRKIVKAYIEEREQQRAIAARRAKEAREALAKKIATRHELSPKTSLASSRGFKNPSSRQGNSVKRPVHSSSSKNINSLIQANTAQKPNSRKKPNNRWNR